MSEIELLRREFHILVANLSTYIGQAHLGHASINDWASDACRSAMPPISTSSVAHWTKKQYMIKWRIPAGSETPAGILTTSFA